MQVLIKGITDDGGTGSISHVAGKFSYGYTLTLFVVEDKSLTLKKIATDKFLASVSNGLGWTYSPYNGQEKREKAIAWIKAATPGGTVGSYLEDKVGLKAPDPPPAAAAPVTSSTDDPKAPKDPKAPPVATTPAPGSVVGSGQVGDGPRDRLPGSKRPYPTKRDTSAPYPENTLNFPLTKSQWTAVMNYINQFSTDDMKVNYPYDNKNPSLVNPLIRVYNDIVSGRDAGA